MCCGQQGHPRALGYYLVASTFSPSYQLSLPLHLQYSGQFYWIEVSMICEVRFLLLYCQSESYGVESNRSSRSTCARSSSSGKIDCKISLVQVGTLWVLHALSLELHVIFDKAARVLWPLMCHDLGQAASWYLLGKMWSQSLAESIFQMCTSSRTTLKWIASFSLLL